MIRLAAVIPAAGLSSRMGMFKPLLPLGQGTVVSACVELFRSQGIEDVIVVTGKRADEVAAAAREAGAVPVPNPDFELGMYTSVKRGVESVTGSVDGFFMLPVDIPLVRRQTVGRLMAAFEEKRPAVLYPRFFDERGHPPVIAATLIPEIMRHDGEGGLRTVLSRHEANALDLDVADYGVSHDLDHPADYEFARELYGREYPLPEEAEQLWAMHNGIEHIFGHCRAVAQVAVALAEKMNDRNHVCRLNVGLVRGAALTHDVGKGTKQHEKVGADILRSHGFHAAADIVAEHFDTSLEQESPITEKEIVFLADKLVRCHSPVPLESRYLEKAEMYAHEPGAREAILGRMGRARDVMDRFDLEAGIPAEQVAREALA